MGSVPSRASAAFNAKTIGEEIEDGRAKRAGLTVVDAARAAGIGRTHWYDKVDGSKPFRWEEVALLIKAFGAPPGWPILSWAEAERLLHLEGELKLAKAALQAALDALEMHKSRK